jgi:hypothetical protein
MTFNEFSEAVHEDLNAIIVSFSSEEKTCRVIFECDDWTGGNRRRRFELFFEDVPEVSVWPSGCSGIHAAKEHPLLWEYNDESVSMFFSSPPLNPLALLGKLYETHTSLIGRWRTMSAYWIADSKLLQGGHGRLAIGPRRVLEEYARTIGDTLSFSIVHGHQPRGGYRVVLFDEHYVICRGISVVERELT